MSPISRVVAFALFGASGFSPSFAGQVAVQEGNLVASDAASLDQLGSCVAVLGDTALVGAPNDSNAAGVHAGAVYVYQRSGGAWNQQLKLIGSDTQAGDQFGRDVTIDGDTAILGAAAASAPGQGRCGAAYVFVRSGGSWMQQAKLVATAAVAGEGEGMKVDVSGDTAVMGLELAAIGAQSNAGRAHVFVRSGSTWAEQATLVSTEPQGGEQFGSDVAIDGDTIVVGARKHRVELTRDDYIPNAGGAYVFTRAAATWAPRTLLLGSTSSGLDEAGTSVDVDGGTIAMGVPFDTLPGHPGGAVFVFTGSGASWTEQARIAPAELASHDDFGTSVALEGNRLVAGAPSDTQLPTFRAGAAYVFDREGTTWPTSAVLYADVPQQNRRMARSIALSSDTVLAGAFEDDVAGLEDAGSAFAWRLSNAAGFCFGDGSLATACPCAPPNIVPVPSAAPGHGCANSQNGNGATLTASGSLNAAFQLSATIAPSYVGFAFLVKGNAQVASGIAYGDGVRCVGGQLIRFGGHNASTNGAPAGTWTYPNSAQTTAVTEASAQPASQTAVYQLLYRDVGASFCSPETTNITSGVIVFWH